jgi:hypothetical protein
MTADKRGLKNYIKQIKELANHKHFRACPVVG